MASLVSDPVPARALRALSVLAGLAACYLGFALALSLGPGQPCPTGIGCGEGPAGATVVSSIAVAMLCAGVATAAWRGAGALTTRAERAGDPWGDVRARPAVRRPDRQA